ncbi:MAG: DUF2157 domain-containing protein [Pseudomonas sp.]
MKRDLRQTDQLLSWAEQGYLTAAQLKAAGEGQQLTADEEQWHWLLEWLLVLAGVVLLALGVIFFFAWNWETLHRFIKFALAFAALSGFVGMALFAARHSLLRRSALLGCCLTTGALLALIGQTYQTGADPWQLFAIWALLMLPWALLARSTACWALCWAVANLALLRFFSVSMWFGLFAGLKGYQALLIIALCNLAVGLLFEWRGQRLLDHAGRALPRLAALGCLGALVVGATISWWESDFVPLLLVYLLVAAVGIPAYRYWRLDLPILALLLFSLIAVVSSGLIRLLVDTDEVLLFNVLGLFIIGASALVSVWLHRLYRESQL